MGDPLTNRPNRGPDGRFLAGNKVAVGRGSPYADKVMLWRAALVRAVTPADVEHVFRLLVAQARQGERWAVELLLDRCLGKPPQFAELEILPQIDELCRQVFGSNNNGARPRAYRPT